MEPLHPDLRKELKRVHPGLDDETIDEYERLTNRRMALDPQTSRSRIVELDAERAKLVATRMPQLATVRSAVTSRNRARAAASAKETGVVVRILDRSSDDGAV